MQQISGHCSLFNGKKTNLYQEQKQREYFSEIRILQTAVNFCLNSQESQPGKQLHTLYIQLM